MLCAHKQPFPGVWCAVSEAPEGEEKDTGCVGSLSLNLEPLPQFRIWELRRPEEPKVQQVANVSRELREEAADLHFRISPPSVPKAGPVAGVEMCSPACLGSPCY